MIFPNWMNHDEPLAGEDGLLILFTFFRFLASKFRSCMLDALVRSPIPQKAKRRVQRGPAMSCSRFCDSSIALPNRFRENSARGRWTGG